MKIKEWYMKTYPSDELGVEIADCDFENIFDILDNKDEFLSMYSYLYEEEYDDTNKQVIILEEESCFIFNDLEEIEIENTDMCSMQDLIDNSEFRKNNYILTSGKNISIG